MQLWIKNFRIKEVHIRWVGILLVSYIMTLVYPTDPGEGSIEKFLTSFTFTATYWNIAFFFFIYFRKRYPEIKKTPQRLLITGFTVTLIFAVIDPILCIAIENESFSDAISWDNILSKLPKNLIPTAIIGSLYENAYFFDKWKNQIQANEALKNQQVRTQFEVLQNQMSPHFLFNSLNTLTTVIAEDSNIAIKFTEKLSEVYRYILQNREKELVKLEEELEFVKNYVFLLQIRYPENLKIDYKIDDAFLETSIPPLTLQMLVENAIKHNVISRSRPLRIDIYVENGKTVIVKNNLQIKNTLEKSTKTGLSNIKERYAYFVNENIEIITTKDNYMVAVPMLNIQTESDLISA